MQRISENSETDYSPTMKRQESKCEVLGFEKIQQNVDKLKLKLMENMVLCELHERDIKELLNNIKFELDWSTENVQKISSFASDYDYDETLPYNGYRLVLHLFNSCVKHTRNICQKLMNNRTINMQASAVKDQLQSSIDAFKLCNTLLQYSKRIHSKSDGKSLIVHDAKLRQEIALMMTSLNRIPFYSHFKGVHFPKRFKRDVSSLAMAMGCFGTGYFAPGFLLLKIFVGFFSFFVFLLKPLLLATQLAKFGKKPQPDMLKFIKAAFAFSEKISISIFKMFNRGPIMAIHKRIKLPRENIEMSHQTESKSVIISPPEKSKGPSKFTCRLLSFRERSKKSPANHSPLLIIQIHGGAFVTLSSESAEVYLGKWAKATNAPIFCIDYTLAPDAIFPQQIDEVFFAYCWALQHADELGSTASQVVVMGDSAGGMLAINLVQKCIELGVRKPDGLFPMYPVTELMHMSPAKLLKSVDPLLPYSLIQIMKGTYTGSTQITEQNSMYLSPLVTDPHILSQFPPTVIIATNLDQLLDDSIEFSRVLRDAGVDVTLHVFLDVPHGFPYFQGSNSLARKATNDALVKLQELIKATDHQIPDMCGLPLYKTR